MDIVDDQLGDHRLDFRASLDGAERKQTVIGTPASVRASWDGDVLVVEIKRRARPDLLLHNRRWLQLAGGGMFLLPIIKNGRSDSHFVGDSR
jgi:hypothetical protein